MQLPTFKKIGFFAAAAAVQYIQRCQAGQLKRERKRETQQFNRDPLSTDQYINSDNNLFLILDT